MKTNHDLRTRNNSPIANSPICKTLFELGTILVSEIALGRLDEETLQSCLQRHRRGDWGDVPAEIRDGNPAELPQQGCVVSAYWCAGELVVINTFISRSLTSIFLHDGDEMRATIEWTPPWSD